MTDAVQYKTRPLTIGRHRAVMRVAFVAGAPVSLEILWNSGKPPRLTRSQLTRYREQRDTVLRQLGMAALVVDVHADGSTTLTEIGTPGR